MYKNIIARVDMIGFDGEVVESLYFKNKDSLIEEIKENIEIGRPYNLVKYQKNLILNTDELY